jgi:hypothetical protein
MELVKQKGFGECAVACISMVTGKDYNLVLDGIATLYKIKPHLEGINCLQVVGYLQKYSEFKTVREVIYPYYASSAILSVPSLNHVGLLHFIVWDDKRYLDPSLGPKFWPDDAPIINGKRIISIATAIVWD